MNPNWIYEKLEKMKVLINLGTHYSGTIKKWRKNG